MQTHPKARGHAQVAKMPCGLYCGRRKRKNPPRTHKEQVGETWHRPQCSARHLRASPLRPALLGTEKPALGPNTDLDFLYFPPQEDKNSIFTTKITISAIIGKLLQIKLNWRFNWSLNLGSEFKFSVTSSCIFSSCVQDSLSWRIPVGKSSFFSSFWIRNLEVAAQSALAF